jgi:hypothetical protein
MDLCLTSGQSRFVLLDPNQVSLKSCSNRIADFIAETYGDYVSAQDLLPQFNKTVISTARSYSNSLLDK